jgi:hypothetical protein
MLDSKSIRSIDAPRPKSEYQSVSFSEYLAIPLSASIYQAGVHTSGASWTAVFASYDDGTLLWLDDHVSTYEFDLFWKREKIHWTEARRAAIFMMETKFNWFPEPSRYAILQSVDDIPQRYRAFLQEENAMAKLADYEARLDQVASYIHPSQLIRDVEGISLRFSVWLGIGGRIYNIDCRFDNHEHLTYQGELIGKGVGDILVPR